MAASYRYYHGTPSSLDSDYGDLFTGYRASLSKLSATTNPQTINILKEVSDKLSAGQKGVEIIQLSSQMMQAIPKDQTKEVNRLAKLTGVDITLHAPIFEPLGVDTQRGQISESAREATEREMAQVMERAHELNPKGGIPVTFHTSAYPQVVAPPDIKLTEKGEEILSMNVINQETGQVLPVKKEERFRPIRQVKEGDKYVLKKVELEKGGRVYDVYEQIENLNETEWKNNLRALITPLEQANTILRETGAVAIELMRGGVRPEDMGPSQRQAYDRFQNAAEVLQDVHSNLDGLFHRAWKYPGDFKNREVKEKEYKDALLKVRDSFFEGVKNSEGNPILQIQAMQHLAAELDNFRPEIYKPTDEYALERTAKTFGNVAFHSYKKFGEKAPIVSVENPPAEQFGFSRGEDLKKIVKEAQKQFIQKATTEGILGKKLSEKQAKAAAEKMIGVTWDVGHINLLRKRGFGEKELVKESKKIAPFLKHVHLSDNFGMEHAELPMGMGNVPFKEIMKVLGEKGKKARKVAEAGDWWRHFQTSPIRATAEGLGSPFYATDMIPYWNQSLGLQQDYSSGFEGPWLPQINYSVWGGGFSQLPRELGGQVGGGGRGRFAGTPME